MKYLTSYTNTKTEYNLMNDRLEAIDNQRKYLEEEKKTLLNLINSHYSTLEKMERSLQSLEGIEKKLFYEIAIKGLNVTRAVDKIANIYELDSSTIWKKYYPKVKKFIKRY